MTRLFGRLTVVIAAGFGALLAAQLPEFSQQYRQRIGGALQELGRIVAQFDADAERNRLTRQAALEIYDRSGDPFLRDRRVAVSGTLARYDRLSEQKARLEAAPPLMRPVVVLSGPDAELLQGAWADFEPAVPVNATGFVWAALGFFLFGGAVSMLRQLAGVAGRRRARNAPAGPSL